MKFKVTLSSFQEALYKTLPAIPRKSTLPVLEHLYFSLENSKLNIIATDQDITIMSSVAVEAEDGGAVLAPARKLNDIAKAMGSKGEIDFSVNENYEIEINTNKGKYNLKGMSPKEYIELPELKESETEIVETEGEATESVKLSKVLFEKEALARAAEKTVFAVSSDEFRPAMTGVLFEFKGSHFNAVSTDSFRLVKATIKPEEPNYPSDLEIIVPARAVDLLKNAEDNAEMSFIENQAKITHVRFDIGNTVYITRVVDERFPPYDSVIPKEHSHKAVVMQHEIIEAIRRVSIFTSKISNQIRISIGQNEMIISGEDEETGNSGRETVTCEYEGEEVTIGFNFRYLEQALSYLEGESEDSKAAIYFSEPIKPVVIRPNDDEGSLLMLIMPVRLNKN